MQEKLADCPQIRQRLVEKRVGKAVLPAAPKVSVIIPAYNIAAFIAESLDSVFAQTFKDYEIILINDGSTDTEQLKIALAPYSEKITYAEQRNLGASQARNAAICLARGQLLAFLDGDDKWSSDFLESQIGFLEKGGYEMVYCDALLFGEPLFAGKTFMEDAPSSGAVTTKSLMSAECNVITSGTVLKRDLLETSELFDTDLPRMQDFDLWFRLAKNGVRIGYQKIVLINYRVRVNSLSGKNIDRAERNVHSLEVIKRKYQLDEAEQTVWERQMNLYQADLTLEKAKLCLVQGDFAQAQKHFSAANEFYRKPKISLINLLMNVSPRLTRRLYKTLRPAEFAFILPGKP